MIKIVLASFLIFFVSGCSFEKKINSWEKRSSSNLKMYTDAYLSSQDLVAKNSLDRAIKNAKQSDDLSSLAKVYLSECALNIAVGIDDKCSKYTNLEDVVESKRLDAYYSMIQKSIVEKQLEYLPSHYEGFASSFLQRDYQGAAKELFLIEQTSSTLICAALIKDELNATQREQLLKRASLYGYKKAIIFWLDESSKKTNDIEEKQKLQKKIAILTSQE